jgi:hypothetical protein
MEVWDWFVIVVTVCLTGAVICNLLIILDP